MAARVALRSRVTRRPGVHGSGVRGRCRLPRRPTLNQAGCANCGPTSTAQKGFVLQEKRTCKEARDVPQAKKDDILETLIPLMSETRHAFWQDLAVSGATGLIDTDELVLGQLMVLYPALPIEQLGWDAILLCTPVPKRGIFKIELLLSLSNHDIKQRAGQNWLTENYGQAITRTFMFIEGGLFVCRDSILRGLSGRLVAVQDQVPDPSAGIVSTADDPPVRYLRRSHDRKVSKLAVPISKCLTLCRQTLDRKVSTFGSVTVEISYFVPPNACKMLEGRVLQHLSLFQVALTPGPAATNLADPCSPPHSRGQTLTRNLSVGSAWLM
ncbi:hypothetical protein EGW08_006567 [Elysia chlorotica]|uniref:Uncharacterized protein n=1 Tax=Elysia chlorotica TaxID=188477 RepID=A0A3S1A8Y8_ELYCH|nr:hypothetical protein EGW08_006567 [Elysia chlorotica]